MLESVGLSDYSNGGMGREGLGTRVIISDASRARQLAKMN